MEGTRRETSVGRQHIGLATQVRLGKGRQDGEGVVGGMASRLDGSVGVDASTTVSGVGGDRRIVGGAWSRGDAGTAIRRHGIRRRWDEDGNIALAGRIGHLQHPTIKPHTSQHHNSDVCIQTHSHTYSTIITMSIYTTLLKHCTKGEQLICT